jgi:hypothetical protein
MTAPVGPAVPFNHLFTLTDHRGVWQHAVGAVPDPDHGYCLDDVARTAIVAAQLDSADPRWHAVLHICCRFIDDALTDGPARNFMDRHGRWLDAPHSGDHVARAAWALGVLSTHHDAATAAWATTHLRHLAGVDLDRADLHPHVYTLLGIAASADPCSLASEATWRLDQLLDRIPRHGEWLWPEARIRYDAGRFPEALLAIGVSLERSVACTQGRRLLDWLSTIVTSTDGTHRYPGHLGLGPDDDLDQSGDEQPLEAAAYAAAHLAAVRATTDLITAAHHHQQAVQALRWFHGANRLRQPLGDPLTGACHDGLGATHRNHNRGAESTIAYAATTLAITTATR